MHRYLVVANRTLAGTHLRDALVELTKQGPCAFHVVVPAEHPRDHVWTESESNALAAARLDEALRRFSALDAEMDGEVGDADPAMAVEDVLQRGEAFDGIVVSNTTLLPARTERPCG